MNHVLEDVDGRVDLVVTGEWSREAEEILRTQQADRLVLNYARGFRARSLEFLRGLPVHRLLLLARSIRDVEPVYSLGAGLEDLDIEVSESVAISLERLPHLKVLVANWEAVSESVRHVPKLEKLRLFGYSETDLRSLSHLEHLRQLRLKSSPQLESLEGVECFSRLSFLGVYLARRFVDMRALSRFRFPDLEVLEVPNCTRLSTISDIQGCDRLARLDFSECGAIESAGPLESLVRLETLWAHSSTSIADGDLSPIVALPRLTDFRMMPRRHYTPTVQSIESVSAARPGGRRAHGSVTGRV